MLGGGILYLLDCFTVAILKKPGMGFGDVKLLAMLGAFIGWKGVLGTLMIASFLGSGVGIAMIAWFRWRGAAQPAPPADEPGENGEEVTLQGHYLPFGPYLALGGLIFLFFGPELIAWYLTTLQGGSKIEILHM